MGLKELASLYSTYIANLISGGDLLERSKLPEMAVKATFDRVITRGAIKKIWCIQNIPLENAMILTDLIRNEMYLRSPKCRTICNFICLPKKMEVGQEKFRRSMKTASKNYENYKEIFEDLPNHEKRLGKKIKEGNGKYVVVDEKFIEGHKVRNDSFEYIYDHSNKGGHFAVVYMFIEGIATSSKDINDYRNNLGPLLRSLGLKYSEMYGNIGAYLKTFSPTGDLQDKSMTGVNAMLLSDENLASILCYGEEGIIGNAGVYTGMIRSSKSPLMINYTEGTTAQVIGVCAKSGHGKTVTVINCLNSHIALGHYVNVMDYKGNEYTALGNIVNSVEISMKDTDSVFVNTLRLDGLERFDDSTKELMYSQCIKATIEKCSAMVNLKTHEGSEQDLEIILHDAIQKLYDSRDIEKSRYYTYDKTKNIKMSEVLEGLSSLTTRSSYTKSQRELVQLALNRISVYLSEEGQKRHLFQKEITMSDVLDAQVVIYNFGKNEGAEDFTVEDTIRINDMKFLNTRKTQYAKLENKFVVDVYEELQRANNNPKIVRDINHGVTGGRSDNKILYLIFNSPSIFERAGDDLRAVRSNITTYIIGYLEQSDVDLMLKMFNIREIEPYLRLISEDQRNFNRNFAVKFDTGVTRGTALVKVELPKHIMDSDLFKTRDTEMV